VLDELVKNIQLKIPKATKPLQAFLEAAPPQIIKDPEKIQISTRRLAHSKDQIILQAAINSRTKFLVTGNLKHFAAAKIYSQFSLQILSPAQMVKLFKL